MRGKVGAGEGRKAKGLWEDLGYNPKCGGSHGAFALTQGSQEPCGCYGAGGGSWGTTSDCTGRGDEEVKRGEDMLTNSKPAH